MEYPLVCVIGKFKEFSYHHARFLDDLRSTIGEEAFPWKGRELLFQPATTDMAYFFDESMRRIAEGFQNCGNAEGLRSLMSVWYNYDTFTAEDGLYAEVLARVPEQECQTLETSEVIPKVFFVIHNHTPMQEGEKVKFDLTAKAFPDDPRVASSIRDCWMRMNVEKRGRITNHIFLGKKGEIKKVHIFSRPNEPATYENTPKHHPPRVLPFRKVTGVLVENGGTYSYHVNREGTRPNKPESEKED